MVRDLRSLTGGAGGGVSQARSGLLLFEVRTPPGWQRRQRSLGGCRRRQDACSSGSPSARGLLVPESDSALERPTLPPLVGAWWKRAEMPPKAQLMQVLRKTKTRMEQDRAVVLLRRLEPCPRHDLDSEGIKANLQPLEFATPVGFVCWRCDKVFQSYYAASWATSRGTRQICHGCHRDFLEREEAESRRANPWLAAPSMVA
mmetsp:Transcript_139019/g.387764  ORF Transcript_139019/g.387764 Transcript_139019/m.387764 type:complete len:202 (+) Transcript_139019:94-699(+)